MSTVVSFGEIMLRLKSPGSTRLFQEPVLEATFGGGEANVAVSLAILGVRSSYVTALPSTPIGDAVISELGRHHVSTEHIFRAPGRLGIYFLESGAAQRPSSVWYDRDNSVFSQVKPGTFNWTDIFSSSRWFHLTGITPALSPNAAECALEAVQAAKKAGLTVSIDLNYRSKLWNYGTLPPEVMGPLTGYADVLIANEEDIQRCLGIKADVMNGSSGEVNREGYRDLVTQVRDAYPNLSHVAVTLRESHAADSNDWSALLSSGKDFFFSEKYRISSIVDRVGAGDAFSAGLIYSLLSNSDDRRRALEFATAAACLKHTIPGDFNLSRKEEIESLMNGNKSGRIQR